MVQLNDSLLERLDRRAAASGTSRSQLIRDAVEAYLAADRERALDAAIVRRVHAHAPGRGVRP